MNVCMNCGNTLESEDRFCMLCGTPVKKPSVSVRAAVPQAFCMKCGSKLEEGLRFCTSCGAPREDERANEIAASSVDTGAALRQNQGAAQQQKQGLFSKLFKKEKEQPAGSKPLSACVPPQVPNPSEPPFGGEHFGGGSAAGPMAFDNAAVSPSPFSQSTHPVYVAPRDSEGRHVLKGMEPVEDPTVVQGLASSGFDNAADEETIVLSAAAPAAFVVRMATGERISLGCLTGEEAAVLGKGSAATHQVAGNPAISRTHIRITWQDGQFYLEDLESTNKTKLNGIELSPRVPSVLASGDTLDLADEAFAFQTEL